MVSLLMRNELIVVLERKPLILILIFTQIQNKMVHRTLSLIKSFIQITGFQSHATISTYDVVMDGDPYLVEMRGCFWF